MGHYTLATFIAVAKQSQYRLHINHIRPSFYIPMQSVLYLSAVCVILTQTNVTHAQKRGPNLTQQSQNVSWVMMVMMMMVVWVQEQLLVSQSSLLVVWCFQNLFCKIYHKTNGPNYSLARSECMNCSLIMLCWFVISSLYPYLAFNHNNY